MCVDVSQGAIDSLVTLILQHEFVLLWPDSLTLDPLSTAPSSKGSNGHDGHGALEVQEIAEAVVLSALNILTNQLFQLLRGATPAQVRTNSEYPCLTVSPVRTLFPQRLQYLSNAHSLGSILTPKRDGRSSTGPRRRE